MKYDVVISISTYNRYDNLIELIKSIKTQDTQYNYLIVIIDDYSSDERYMTLNSQLVDTNIEIIRCDTNNGKQGYWITINKLFSFLKTLDFDFFIQLDDDFIICNNFLNTVIGFIKQNQIINPNICAVSLHLNNESELTDNRWGFGNNWIDGGTIYSREILNFLDFNILPIGKQRWSHNPSVSSGVWQQVSGRIYKSSFKAVKPNYSFVKHNDSDISVMNVEFRKENPITTYNFIDDFADVSVELIKDVLVTKVHVNEPTTPVELPKSLKEQRQIEKDKARQKALEYELKKQKEKEELQQKILAQEEQRALQIKSAQNQMRRAKILKKRIK